MSSYGSIPDGAAPTPSPPPQQSGYTPLPTSDDAEQPLRRGSKHGGDGRCSLSSLQAAAVIATLSGVAFSSSMSTGLLTVCLPSIADELNLPDALILWPSAAYSLACACCLLLAGSFADEAGDTLINIAGSVTLAASVLANGLAKDAAQLIAYRVLQGVGASMSLATGVSLVTRSLQPGRARNFAFSCLGVSQPLGFSVGLVVGGMTQASPYGWRLGYYICAGTLGLFVVTGWTSLPSSDRLLTWSAVRGLATSIDWFGVLISSAGLGLVSYCCAIVTQDLEQLWQPTTIVALIGGFVLLAMFPWWMSRQTHLGRPALMPNALWASPGFVAICVTVFFAWASMQSSELFTSLYFQKVQMIPPLEASFKLLPGVLTGFIVNPVTGLSVQHFKCYKLLAWACAVASLSPLILALMDPSWSFWVAACWAVALAPVSIDILFTIAHLVVADVFPPSMHALAGGVFNTVAQLGTSMGMSIAAIISSSVTKASQPINKESPEALLPGYRAAFYACAALMLLSACTSFGLRRLGKLGIAAPAE